MAALESIAEARIEGALLSKLFGVAPSYEYNPDHVRIYYQPDRLKQVQDRVNQMATSGPGDVRIDWFPMIQPIVLKQALPYAIGAIALGYFLGKMT